jgi:hypothetical protein
LHGKVCCHSRNRALSAGVCSSYVPRKTQPAIRVVRTEATRRSGSESTTACSLVPACREGRALAPRRLSNSLRGSPNRRASFESNYSNSFKRFSAFSKFPCRSARCPWRRAACPACAACRVSFQPRLQPNLSTHCPDRRRQARQPVEFHRKGYRKMAAATSLPSSAPDAPKVRPSSCAIGKEVQPAPLGQGPRRMRDSLPKDRRVACSTCRQVNPTRGTDASAFTPAESLCRIHCRKGR